MDSEFASATDNLTGAFRADFAQLSSRVIVPAAHRDSIITRAKVVGTSLVAADPGKVTLLLFLDQETTSAVRFWFTAWVSALTGCDESKCQDEQRKDGTGSDETHPDGVAFRERFHGCHLHLSAGAVNIGVS
ncbi:hypothetical protein [Nocardia sp. CA-119907]|uniref:hypothetical protein n=1 Tax=Nocardia sp. CA-119907 TaxID=3239973 RepID=UPI003D95AE7A